MTKAMEEVAAETGKAGPKQSARRMAAYLAHRDALRDLQATGYDPGELVAHAKRFWSIVMAPKWARREEGRHLKRVERDVDVLLGLLEERLRKGMAWDQAMDEMAFLSVAKRGEAPAVTLSTVHSAKGLEWDHVHYAGLNDLRERQRDDPDEREEERRGVLRRHNARPQDARPLPAAGAGAAARSPAGDRAHAVPLPAGGGRRRGGPLRRPAGPEPAPRNGRGPAGRAVAIIRVRPPGGRAMV